MGKVCSVAHLMVKACSHLEAAREGEALSILLRAAARLSQKSQFGPRRARPITSLFSSPWCSTPLRGGMLPRGFAQLGLLPLTPKRWAKRLAACFNLRGKRELNFHPFLWHLGEFVWMTVGGCAVVVGVGCLPAPWGPHPAPWAVLLCRWGQLRQGMEVIPSIHPPPPARQTGCLEERSRGLPPCTSSRTLCEGDPVGAAWPGPMQPAPGAVQIAKIFVLML